MNNNQIDLVKQFIHDEYPDLAIRDIVRYTNECCNIYPDDTMHEAFNKINSLMAHVHFKIPKQKVSIIKIPLDATSRYYYLLRAIQYWLYWYDSDMHKEGNYYYAYHNGYYHKIPNEKLMYVIYELLHYYGDVNKSDTSLSSKLAEFNISGYLKEFPKGYTYINTKDKILAISYDGIRIFDAPHERRYFFKYKLPVNYDSNATEFKYLNKIFDNLHPTDLLSIQTFLASCLLPTMKTEKCLYIFGKGGTGKSTFAEAIRALFTSELVSSVSLENISHDHNMIFSMKEKLLNISNETSLKAVDFELFKTIVSKEKRQFRKLYSMPEEISEYPRQMIISNNYPNIDAEGAIARRLAIVEFAKSPEKLDVGLLDKIIQHDLPALFNWIIQGITPLINEGVITSKSTEKIIEEIKGMSSIGVFIEEVGFKMFDLNEPIRFNEFYKAYSDFCKERHLRADSNKIFSRKLQHDYGFEVYKYGHDKHTFIRLKRKQ